MKLQVPELIVKAAAKREIASPVDVVMGEDWGEVELGTSLRLSLLKLMQLRQAGASKSASARGGGASNRLRVPLSVFKGGRSAMVKVIKKGGTTNARGMRDQMSYLSKDGDAKLERSERYFGIELDDVARERLIESWGLSGETKTQSDKTTHFVVSFPTDTDHGAAYRAGRAWAEEMFASGRYGDVYDYYTAFHTDRAHPHMHVVVNRRGMEHEDWLKVSLRSQFNYDELRAVQVEVAALEGIRLEASPRVARGVTDRPIPDAEIRRAERENREAEAPAHTLVTALRAAANIVLYSLQMTTDARLLRERHPELAQDIQKIADTIITGRQFMPGGSSAKQTLSDEEVRDASEYIMSRRSEILDGIREIDADISALPIGADRSRLERDASIMKAETAELLPDVAELQLHTIENVDGLYRGIKAEDGIELDVKARADQEIAKLAEAAGIDAEKFIGRFEGSTPVSQELADRWRNDELEDIQKNLTYQDRQTDARAQMEPLAQAAYDELHRNALQTYRKAERDLQAHRAKKRELQRIAKLVKEGRALDGEVTEKFAQTVKDTLLTTELRSLEAGEANAFKHITADPDQQRALSRRYLEAETQEADGARKLQLETALAKIDQDAHLATQRATEQARRAKDRGLDL